MGARTFEIIVQYYANAVKKNKLNNKSFLSLGLGMFWVHQDQ